MSVKSPESGERRDGTLGNVMLMGVMVVSLLSMFGVVMTSRMVMDSNTAGRRISATKALYLADSGIQRGRRSLWLGSLANSSAGPSPIGDGTFRSQVQQTNIYWLGSAGGDNEDVYQITGTGVVGNATRVVYEFRYRGGANDLNFMTWREAVADEY